MAVWSSSSYSRGVGIWRRPSIARTVTGDSGVVRCNKQFTGNDRQPSDSCLAEARTIDQRHWRRRPRRSPLAVWTSRPHERGYIVAVTADPDLLYDALLVRVPHCDRSVG